MRGISTELKVGVFALLILSVLAFMTFKVGGLEWTKAKGYMVYIYFDNTAGMDDKTKVKVAGVDAGVIDGIELTKGRAKVRLRIDPQVKMYKNASASIKSSGLLGDKFLSLSIGTPDSPVLREGETIENVIELVDIDDMARNLMNFSKSFGKLSDALNEVFGTEESKQSLKQTITSLRDLTANLNRTVDANDYKLRKALDNVNALTDSLSRLVDRNSDNLTSTVTNMKDFSGNLKSQGPELIGNLSKATNDLRALIEDNRPAIKSTVESFDNIAKRIEKGEGSIGKLVKDDRLYESVNKAAEGLNKTLSIVDKFRTYITFQSDYLTKPKDAKGTFSVTLQPSPDKYYILGVVGDPVAQVKKTDTVLTPPGVTISEDEVKKRIEFNAQFGRRFGDTAVRLGLTESTFGIGGDYYFNKDKGKVVVDAWDFSKDEEYAKNPHVKVGLEYFLYKNFFVSAGLDNLLNSKWRGGYAGVGVRFEDEDFKYLLGTLPKLPTN